MLAFVTKAPQIRATPTVENAKTYVAHIIDANPQLQLFAKDRDDLLTIIVTRTESWTDDGFRESVRENLKETFLGHGLLELSSSINVIFTAKDEPREKLQEDIKEYALDIKNGRVVSLDGAAFANFFRLEAGPNSLPFLTNYRRGSLTRQSERLRSVKDELVATFQASQHSQTHETAIALFSQMRDEVAASRKRLFDSHARTFLSLVRLDTEDPVREKVTKAVENSTIEAKNLLQDLADKLGLPSSRDSPQLVSAAILAVADDGLDDLVRYGYVPCVHVGEVIFADAFTGSVLDVLNRDTETDDGFFSRRFRLADFSTWKSLWDRAKRLYKTRPEAQDRGGLEDSDYDPLLRISIVSQKGNDSEVVFQFTQNTISFTTWEDDSILQALAYGSRNVDGTTQMSEHRLVVDVNHGISRLVVELTGRTQRLSMDYFPINYCPSCAAGIFGSIHRLRRAAIEKLLSWEDASRRLFKSFKSEIGPELYTFLEKELALSLAKESNNDTEEPKAQLDYLLAGKAAVEVKVPELPFKMIIMNPVTKTMSVATSWSMPFLDPILPSAQPNTSSAPSQSLFSFEASRTDFWSPSLEPEIGDSVHIRAPRHHHDGFEGIIAGSSMIKRAQKQVQGFTVAIDDDNNRNTARSVDTLLPMYLQVLEKGQRNGRELQPRIFAAHFRQDGGWAQMPEDGRFWLQSSKWISENATQEDSATTQEPFRLHRTERHHVLVLPRLSERISLFVQVSNGSRKYAGSIRIGDTKQDGQDVPASQSQLMFSDYLHNGPGGKVQFLCDLLENFEKQAEDEASERLDRMAMRNILNVVKPLLGPETADVTQETDLFQLFVLEEFKTTPKLISHMLDQVHDGSPLGFAREMPLFDSAYTRKHETTQAGDAILFRPKSELVDLTLRQILRDCVSAKSRVAAEVTPETVDLPVEDILDPVWDFMRAPMFAESDPGTAQSDELTTVPAQSDELTTMWRQHLSTLYDEWTKVWVTLRQSELGLEGATQSRGGFLSGNDVSQDLTLVKEQKDSMIVIAFHLERVAKTAGVPFPIQFFRLLLNEFLQINCDHFLIFEHLSDFLVIIRDIFNVSDDGGKGRPGDMIEAATMYKLTAKAKRDVFRFTRRILGDDPAGMCDQTRFNLSSFQQILIFEILGKDVDFGMDEMVQLYNRHRKTIGNVGTGILPTDSGLRTDDDYVAKHVSTYIVNVLEQKERTATGNQRSQPESGATLRPAEEFVRLPVDENEDNFNEVLSFQLRRAWADNRHNFQESSEERSCSDRGEDCSDSWTAQQYFGNALVQHPLDGVDAIAQLDQINSMLMPDVKRISRDTPTFTNDLPPNKNQLLECGREINPQSSGDPMTVAMDWSPNLRSKIRAVYYGSHDPRSSKECYFSKLGFSEGMKCNKRTFKADPCPRVEKTCMCLVEDRVAQKREALQLVADKYPGVKLKIWRDADESSPQVVSDAGYVLEEEFTSKIFRNVESRDFKFVDVHFLKEPRLASGSCHSVRKTRGSWTVQAEELEDRDVAHDRKMRSGTQRPGPIEDIADDRKTITWTPQKVEAISELDEATSSRKNLKGDYDFLGYSSKYLITRQYKTSSYMHACGVHSFLGNVQNGVYFYEEIGRRGEVVKSARQKFKETVAGCDTKELARKLVLETRHGMTEARGLQRQHAGVQMLSQLEVFQLGGNRAPLSSQLQDALSNLYVVFDGHVASWQVLEDSAERLLAHWKSEVAVELLSSMRYIDAAELVLFSKILAIQTGVSRELFIVPCTYGLPDSPGYLGALEMAWEAQERGAIILRLATPSLGHFERVEIVERSGSASYPLGLPLGGTGVTWEIRSRDSRGDLIDPGPEPFRDFSDDDRQQEQGDVEIRWASSSNEEENETPIAGSEFEQVTATSIAAAQVDALKPVLALNSLASESVQIGPSIADDIDGNDGADHGFHSATTDVDEAEDSHGDASDTVVEPASVCEPDDFVLYPLIDIIMQTPRDVPRADTSIASESISRKPGDGRDRLHTFLSNIMNSRVSLHYGGGTFPTLASLEESYGPGLIGSSTAKEESNQGQHIRFLPMAFLPLEYQFSVVFMTVTQTAEAIQHSDTRKRKENTSLKSRVVYSL